VNEEGKYPGLPGLPPAREAEILPTRFRSRFSAARPNDFLTDFEASSHQADSAKGFLAGHPVLHLVFGGHLLIGAKFLI
jgi:hypothetical protein